MIWERLGDVRVLVDPFMGSLAVLLNRPHPPQIETVNDKDGFLVNAWRAIKNDPEKVVYYADDIVSEVDLHARHVWLLERRDTLIHYLTGDPEYYDAKAAGWWIWGSCCWIGSGWCSGVGPWHMEGGVFTKTADPASKIARGPGIQAQTPRLSSGGQGIHRKVPHLSTGRGVHRKRPELMNSGKGVHRLTAYQADGEGSVAEHHAFLLDWFGRLSDRLRRVRIVCGEWDRILGPSGTVHLGLTGVVLDPPYPLGERDAALYREDEQTASKAEVWHQARDWAVAHGNDPKFRIALCGYEGEDMPEDWTIYSWKTSGGYGSQGAGRGRENAGREVIWFSPHCRTPQDALPLFAGVTIA